MIPSKLLFFFKINSVVYMCMWWESKFDAKESPIPYAKIPKQLQGLVDDIQTSVCGRDPQISSGVPGNNK